MESDDLFCHVGIHTNIALKYIKHVLKRKKKRIGFLLGTDYLGNGSSFVSLMPTSRFGD